MGLGAFFPPAPPPEVRAEKAAEEQAKAELAALRGELERGGFPEAVARMLIAVMKKRGAIDRRSFLIAHELSEHQPDLPELSEADLHSLVAKQALLMQLDPEAALRALPRLLPSEADRERAVAHRGAGHDAGARPVRPRLARGEDGPEIPRPRTGLAHDPGPGRARGDVMSGDYLENRTFDEIRVGDSASLVRTLTDQDLRLFAAVSGDVNPTHVDEEYARRFLSGRLVGHSLWSGALISGVLGTKLPGPGTVYVSQDLRFLGPVRVGDTVTATVTARAKRADGHIVEFDCRCVNQHGEAVAAGVAVVRAPAERVRVPCPEPPEVAVQAHSKYEALLERCRGLPPAPRGRGLPVR